MVNLFSRAKASSRKVLLASALAVSLAAGSFTPGRLAQSSSAKRPVAASAQVAAPQSGNYGLTALSKRFFWNFVAAKLPIPGLDFLITYPQMKELQKEARLADAGRNLLIRSAVGAGRPVPVVSERLHQAPSVAVARPEIAEVVARHLARRQSLQLFGRRHFALTAMRPPIEKRAIASKFQVRLPARTPVEAVQRVKLRPSRRSA